MPDNEEFRKSIDHATRQIVAGMGRNVEACCLIVEGDAKKNCPVDMGILRASITHETEVTPQAIIGRIGSSLEHAPYVHQGTGIYAVDGTGRKMPWGYTVKAGKYKGFHWTRGQKPQPFLKNAVINNRSRIERRLAD